jgi:hypothetical protein
MTPRELFVAAKPWMVFRVFRLRVGMPKSCKRDADYFCGAGLP